MGSLARRARRRGAASSAAKLRKERATRRRRESAENAAFAKAIRAERPVPKLDLELLESLTNPWRIFDEADAEMTRVALGRLEMIEPPGEGFDAFEKTIRQADEAMRQTLLGQSVLVDDRNEPAELLRAMQERLGFSAGKMAAGAGALPGVAETTRAGVDREVEIVKARQAAELGAVVLADGGGVVPREEAALVDGRWVRRDPEPARRAPGSPTRAMQLLALVAGITASSGLPPRGSR
jgi:hypothetical protein